MKFFNEILDFIFPRACEVCGKKLETGVRFVCPYCRQNFASASDDILAEEYQRKFSKDKIIAGFHSQFVFQKNFEFQKIIHALKYEKKYRLGIYLGELIATLSRDKILDRQIDFIIPVPLHRLKKAKRGFNQAFYISVGLSKKLNIPINDKLLKRSRMTETQTKLNAKERAENMSGAFELRKNISLEDKTFLLIDDVITTGATVKECAIVLKNAGAKKIYAASAGISHLDPTSGREQINPELSDRFE